MLRAPRERVEIREIELLPPEPGAIVAQVEAATVCGTDVHMWQGELQPEWPVGLGHEMVGSVAALGEGLLRIPPISRSMWATASSGPIPGAASATTARLPASQRSAPTRA